MWIARVALGRKCGAGGLDSPGTPARSVPSRSINEAVAAPASPFRIQEKNSRLSMREDSRRLQSVDIEELVAIEDRPCQGGGTELPDNPDRPVSFVGLGPASESNPIRIIHLGPDVATRFSLQAVGERIALVEDEGVIHHRQGLKRGRRDGAPGGGG